MSGRLRQVARLVLDRLPSRSPQGVARRLIVLANAARDARQWQIASVLYEEALRFTPTARIHKQCGHMFKEAGLMDAAEAHYLEAARLSPNDADLALQIGHFEKIRGDLHAAEAAYRRALSIKPGWNEPQEELGRLNPAASVTADMAVNQGLIPELLPGDAPQYSTYRETIQIRHLGRMAWGRDGYKRMVGGVEAIRGFCISSKPIEKLIITCNDVQLVRRSLTGVSLPGGHIKYWFNIWLDLSHVARGDGVFELRFIDTHGGKQVHRLALEVTDPVSERVFPDSDSIVDAPAHNDEDLVATVNARPSVVRASSRAQMHDPVAAIVVQRIDQLGDLIVSVPALWRLRELFADSHIVLVVSPANTEFARTLDMVDEVLTVETIAQSDGRRAIAAAEQNALKRNLSRRRFDLAIDLSQGAESRPLLRLSAAKFTYGFRTPLAPWLTSSFDLNAPDPFNGLETCSPARKLLAMVDAIGRTHQQLPAPPAPRVDAEILRSCNVGSRPYVILHAGARLDLNRWPFFDELAHLLIEHTAFDVVVMGKELPPSLAGHDRVRLLNGMLPFASFDALIGGCAVFVGNDSGPKHLAAVRGVATISLHLARLNWSEWGQEWHGSIISRRVPCAGCAITLDANECAMDLACLRNIRPEEVLAEIARLGGSVPRIAEALVGYSQA